MQLLPPSDFAAVFGNSSNLPSVPQIASLFLGPDSLMLAFFILAFFGGGICFSFLIEVFLTGAEDFGAVEDDRELELDDDELELELD